jgi:adenine phosphoribosyltransferase
LSRLGGGTAAARWAVAGLVELLGGQIAGFGFLIELEFLKDRGKIHSYDIHSILKH